MNLLFIDKIIIVLYWCDWHTQSTELYEYNIHYGFRLLFSKDTILCTWISWTARQHVVLVSRHTRSYDICLPTVLMLSLMIANEAKHVWIKIRNFLTCLNCTCLIMHLHLYAQTVEYPCLTLKMKALCTFKQWELCT